MTTEALAEGEVFIANVWGTPWYVERSKFESVYHFLYCCEWSRLVAANFHGGGAEDERTTNTPKVFNVTVTLLGSNRWRVAAHSDALMRLRRKPCNFVAFTRQSSEGVVEEARGFYRATTLRSDCGLVEVDSAKEVDANLLEVEWEMAFFTKVR